MTKVPTEKFPDKAPELDIAIKATLQADFDKYSNGTLNMSAYPSDIKLNGEVVGCVAHAIPTGVSVTIGKRHYIVHYKDIWEAVYNAEKASSECK